MNNIEQLKQLRNERQFLANHHAELEKTFLRDVFTLDNAIVQAEAELSSQQDAVVEENEEQV